MRIIRPTKDTSEHIPIPEDLHSAIFLAGPCTRYKPDGTSYGESDWRNEVISYLTLAGFDGDIIDPTNPNYNNEDPDYLRKQTEWEHEGLHRSSAIIFWFARTKEAPALTSNIEYGMWYDKPSVFIGCPEYAIKNSYIINLTKSIGGQVYTQIQPLCEAVLSSLSPSTPRTWFTSDTHLGQQRTLELSKRPFRDLTHMDSVILSNWNKTVRDTDTVVCLGDFGNLDYLKGLNFRRLLFVTGNYERREYEESISKLQEVSKVRNMPFTICGMEDKLPEAGITILPRAYKYTLKDGTVVRLVHEPLNPDGASFKQPDDLFCYGHIHGRTMYKQNGVDCASDISNYTPISEDYLLWRLNAIQFLDNNVWCLRCNL